MPVYPKGPCTQIVDTLAPKYLCRDYFKAKVYTIWVHGLLGIHHSPSDLGFGVVGLRSQSFTQDCRLQLRSARSGRVVSTCRPIEMPFSDS